MYVSSSDASTAVVLLVAGLLVQWVVVFTAVRVAIGPLRAAMAPPSFVAVTVGGDERPVIALTNRGGTAAFRIRAAWQGQTPEPGVEAGFANPGDTIQWTAPARPTARPDAGPQLLAVWWIVPGSYQDRNGSEYVPVYVPPVLHAAEA